MEPKSCSEIRQIITEVLGIKSKKIIFFIRVSHLTFEHGQKKNITIDEPAEQYSPPVHT
jgi:hypothetical protein